MFDGERKIGAFFDTPACVTFSIDFEKSGKAEIFCEGGNLNLYLIESESAYGVAREF